MFPKYQSYNDHNTDDIYDTDLHGDSMEVNNDQS